MCPLNAGQGPGNLVPDKHFVQCLAAEAISKGEIVALCVTAADGYTVVLADSGAVTTQIVYGVSTEEIADAAWGKIQVAGFCDYIVTDGGVTAGQMLVASGTAGMASGVIITTANSTAFAHSLTADTGAVATDVLLYRVL